VGYEVSAVDLPGWLDIIAEHRAQDHQELGITGSMVVKGIAVSEWLECPADEASAVIHELQNDLDVLNLKINGMQHLPARMYSEWSMHVSHDEPACALPKLDQPLGPAQVQQLAHHAVRGMPWHRLAPLNAWGPAVGTLAQGYALFIEPPARLLGQLALTQNICWGCATQGVRQLREWAQDFSTLYRPLPPTGQQFVLPVTSRLDHKLSATILRECLLQLGHSVELSWPHIEHGPRPGRLLMCGSIVLPLQPEAHRRRATLGSKQWLGYGSLHEATSAEDQPTHWIRSIEALLSVIDKDAGV
jgi:hypothetical protein